MASEILNLIALCRCCHTSGSFTHLDNFNEVTESYATMLVETFGILLTQPAIEASHTICDVCIQKLRNASEFKKQVEDCEKKFENYCKNYEVTIEPEVQIKVDDNNYTSHNLENQEFNGSDVEETGEIILTETETKHDKARKKGENKSQPGPESKQIDQNGSRSGGDRTYNRTDYPCLTCQVTFKYRQSLKGHMQLKHSIFMCNYPSCNITFSTRQLLLNHRLQTHTTSDKYECNMCSKTFKTKTNLSAHVNSHTKQKVYKCDVCNKEFHYRSIIIKHLRLHAGIPCASARCICDVCGYVANDVTTLKWHIINVHKKLKLFKCDQCPKEYASNKNLKIHYRKHTGELPFQCQLCNKAYRAAYNLTVHMRKHDEKIACGEKISNKDKNSSQPTHFRFTCKVCGKGFHRRGSLALHTWTHAGSKPFKCEYCDKDFVCRYSQKRHMALHKPGGPMTFPCEICYKKFRTKASMFRHMRTVHESGAEPNNKPKVKCTLCNRRVFDLEKHMNVHSNKFHQCEFCPKSYSERNVLNRHIKDRHSGIKVSNDCQFCDTKFAQLKTLKNHVLKKHNILFEVKNENEKCE